MISVCASAGPGRGGRARRGAAALTDTELVEAILGRGTINRDVRMIARDIAEAFRQVDAVVTPVSPFPAFKLGEKLDDPLQMYLSDIYTITGSLAGIPCMSVPCGKTAGGLPVGMQILARHFNEPGMFRLADAFERDGGFEG